MRTLLKGLPTPGEPLDPAAPFPAELPEGAPLPEHFLLVRIALAPVELLERQPASRRRWRREAGWQEEPLHP